jgi:hypothetical protein
MITMHPIFDAWPLKTSRKKKLRALDEAVIFPALLVVVVLIGIPLMMLFEICRNPRRRYPVSTRKG